MTDTIRIFVGSDVRMRETGMERTLEHSIRAHTRAQVEITFMCALADPEWSGWASQPDLPYRSRGGTWATHFSGFRWCVPEAAGHRGFAIYLDADMIVLGDIAELWRYCLPGRVATLETGATEVMVMDCTLVGPPIDVVRTKVLRMSGMAKTYPRKPIIPALWDLRDSWTERAKLIHYTNMRTQPWHPWPEAFSYPPRHPNKKAHEIWERYHAEAQE